MATKEEWRERFEQHRRSGLNIAAWCKEQGIRENQYHYWRRRVSAKKANLPAGKFVRVAGGVEGMELLVGDKLRVKIPAEFDSDTLKKLLEVLGC